MASCREDEDLDISAMCQVVQWEYNAWAAYVAADTFLFYFSFSKSEMLLLATGSENRSCGKKMRTSSTAASSRLLILLSSICASYVHTDKNDDKYF
jgi:hypothetical protein